MHIQCPCFLIFVGSGQRHVMVRGPQTATVFTNRPIEPFASQEVVDESVMYELPELFPLAPTIDLVKQHVWRPENVTGEAEYVSLNISSLGDIGNIFC